MLLLHLAMMGGSCQASVLHQAVTHTEVTVSFQTTASLRSLQAARPAALMISVLIGVGLWDHIWALSFANDTGQMVTQVIFCLMLLDEV